MEKTFFNELMVWQQQSFCLSKANMYLSPYHLPAMLLDLLKKINPPGVLIAGRFWNWDEEPAELIAKI